MGVVTSFVFLDIFLGVILILFLVYWFYTKNFDYWDKRSIPNIKKDYTLMNLLGRENQNESVLRMYKQFPNARFAGCFQMRKPMLVIRDTDLIHKILVKDFMHFQNRGSPQQFDDDPLAASLFNLEGQVWRSLRYKLTPTFTTGKLRAMFEQLSKCGNNMSDRIEVLKKENYNIDSKEVLFEFTLDVIASCAFGLQFKPKSPEFNKFKTTVQSLLNISVNTFVRFLILFTSSKLAKFLKLTTFSKEITDYFFNLTKATLKYRRENNIHRNDYFQLLMTLKEQEESGKEIVLTPSDVTEDDAVVIDQMKYTEENGHAPAVNIKVMTEEIICANSFIFLIAGSETVATTISFTLLNLAQHPDIQQRVQQEVDFVLEQRKAWSYDAVRDMTYLDQVVQETQRMYPVVPKLMRECVLPYKVPESDLVIEKGVMISIPVSGLHMDPQYYPDPDRFNPDRFEGNNFKPNPTFLPFGDGPRICIAMRFAVMEVKTCIARIMSEYSVKLSPKTQTPIKLSKGTLAVTVEGGIWLHFDRRNKS